MRTTLLEPDDLLSVEGGDHYELIDGVAVEKVMGAKAGKVTVRLGGRLDTHCEATGLGDVFDGQTGYRCFPGQPKQVRKPDVSVVVRGRFPDDEIPDGDILIPPDLAAEVVSPNETFEEVDRKVFEYLSAGVKLIWIVSPKNKAVHVYRPAGPPALLSAADTLSGEDVVPGFALKVAELFV